MAVSDDAKMTVKEVQTVQQRKDASGGADNAYARLQQDVQAEQTKLGTTTPESKKQYQDYISNVQTELQKSGLLPEMTLEWANSHKEALNVSSNKSDGITKEGLAKYPEVSKQFSGQELGEFDRSFASQLGRDFDSLDKSGKIDNKTLAKELTVQQELHNKVEPLLSMIPPAVFNIMDTASKGGNPDQEISRDDVKAFLKNRNNEITLKGLGFNDQQVADLNAGLTDMEKNWNSDVYTKLRGGKDKNLTADSVAKAFGLIGSDQKSGSDATASNIQPPSDTTQSSKVHDQVVAKLIEDSKAQPGNGYIKIAARLLGKPSANDNDPEVKKLYQELQELNSNKPLLLGDSVLTPEMLAKVTNESLKARIAAQEKALNEQNSAADSQVAKA